MGGALQHFSRGAVGMVHPGVPDAVLGAQRLVGAPAGREPAEKRVERGRSESGPPAAPGGDQVEDVDAGRHLYSVPSGNPAPGS